MRQLPFMKMNCRALAAVFKLPFNQRWRVSSYSPRPILRLADELVDALSVNFHTASSIRTKRMKSRLLPLPISTAIRNTGYRESAKPNKSLHLTATLLALRSVR